ncbi:MAG: hypothetical protein J2P24_21245 [Streptosporangiales bacterium]|nr:hypothetical protein [Streptosporangiales bacterium]
MTTRIWYQSLTDLEQLPGYARQLAEHAAASARPGTEVDVHGVAPGTYPADVTPIDVLRFPAAEYFLNVQVLRNALRAESAGYDAFAVGCFFDPVLTELRSAVDIPVVSICESTLAMSAHAGLRLGMVGIAGVNRDRLETLVERYGHGSRVAAIVGIEPPLTEDDLDAGYHDPAPLLPRFEAAAARCADARADLVIPAEGVFNSLLTRAGIRTLAGLPVVDALAALLSHAEALVHLGRTTGLATSRRHGLARAPEHVLEAAMSSAFGPALGTHEVVG